MTLRSLFEGSDWWGLVQIKPYKGMFVIGPRLSKREWAKAAKFIPHRRWAHAMSAVAHFCMAPDNVLRVT